MAERVLAGLSSQLQISDRLQHLIYLSSSLLFLSGSKGTGKTTIIEQLSNSLPNTTVEHIFSLNAPLSDVQAREKILSLLFEDPLFNSNDSLFTSFIQIQKNQLFQTPYLIVIDNAAFISQNIALELAEMLQNKQQLTNSEFNVLLCSEEDYCSKMILALQSKFLPSNEIFEAVEEVKVKTLSSYEATLLFQHELGKINGSEKNTAPPEKIMQCDGNPLQIVKLINEVQNLQKVQNQKKNIPQKKKIGAMHFLLFFAFFFMVCAGTFLYFNPDLLNKKIETVIHVSDVSEIRVSDKGETPKVEALVVSWSAESKNKSTENKSTKDKSTENKSIIKTSDLDEETTQPLIEQAPLTLTKIDTQADDLAVQENETLKMQASIKADPIVVPTKPVALQIVRPSLLTELAVLKDISSRHYTLQLASMSSKQSFDKFSKKYKLPQKNTFVYQTVRNKKEWFVIIYGNYKTLKEAKTASNQLPSPFKKSDSWVKKFNLVHKELRDASENSK